MAKKFLESMGEAYGEDVLADLIPTRKQTTAKRTPSTAKKPTTRSTTKKNGRGKKRFLDKIDQQMQANRPTRVEAPVSKRPGKKSFLDTIEEALDSNVFDEIIPENPSWGRKKKGAQPSKEAMERFSTMITKEVLDRAREIAKMKGIRIKDVINTALRYYLDSEGK